jgi:murein DD-endopeptidase MepM/ murein hydrolase activator NlpD
MTHNVPYSVINAAAVKSKTVFDVRRLKAGNPYAIIRQSDSEKAVRYFVYEQDPINYVVYDLGDPVNVYIGKKPIEMKIRQVSGVIRSSLSQTFSRLGLEYELVYRLSDLYAWTLDFHHLTEGDHFRFLYEEKYVDGVSVGLGRVVAARFHHKGKDLYGFYYQRNGRGMYYDEDGNSLEKTFLKAPVRYSRITSRPSRHRLHPILKRYRPHLGTDYAANTGTPIHSIGDGIIMKTGFNRGLGKHVEIRHKGIYKTQYLHMSRIAKGIKSRRTVKRGEVIGYVGSTGMATGPHLCFRFWKNGRVFNHLKANLPAGKSLEKKYQSDYQKYVQELKVRLDNIPLNDTFNLAEADKQPDDTTIEN